MRSISCSIYPLAGFCVLAPEPRVHLSMHTALHSCYLRSLTCNSLWHSEHNSSVLRFICIIFCSHVSLPVRVLSFLTWCTDRRVVSKPHHSQRLECRRFVSSCGSIVLGLRKDIGCFLKPSSYSLIVLFFVFFWRNVEYLQKQIFNLHSIQLNLLKGRCAGRNEK